LEVASGGRLEGEVEALFEQFRLHPRVRSRRLRTVRVVDSSSSGVRLSGVMPGSITEPVAFLLMIAEPEGSACPGCLSGIHEARSSALLGEFGKELCPSFLKLLDPGPELSKLALDALELGLRLLFPEVSLTMPGPDQILDLTAEQPWPRVPVRRGGPVLELARVDRRDDLLLR
jgi:hypothetical protein